MVIVEGAIPTLTSAQSSSGHLLSDNSIAWLIVSIPPGLPTLKKKMAILVSYQKLYSPKKWYRSKKLFNFQFDVLNTNLLQDLQ